MAIVNLDAIREAVATRLRSIDGLRAMAYPMDNPTPGPSGVAWVDEPDDDLFIDYHQTGDGACQINLAVKLVIVATNPPQAQRLFDEYRSLGIPRSVADCLEGGGNLGGLVNYLTVRRASAVRIFANLQDGTRYWVVDFDVEVLA